MLKKLFIFEKEFTVTRAATIVGFFAFLSKLAAAFRDPLLSSTFGGDKIYVLDIYQAAFRIPDFLFTLFIAGTLSVAFIPIFVELLIIDKDKAEKVANTVITISMTAMAFLFLLVIIFAYPLTRLLLPGFNSQYITETVNLTRLIALSQIVFTLSNICTNILYAYKRFIMAGIAPLLYNVGIIIGILFFYERFGITGLGYGVLLGALMHLLVQLPELLRSSYKLAPAFYISEESIKRIWKLYLPRIFVIDLSVFSLLISTFVASHLATGSIAIFSLAINLQSIPSSIIALSLATAVFPALAESYAQKDEKKFLQLLRKTLVQVFYFMIPISIFMLVFRAQIVRLYYGHGNFSWENTILTFSTLGILSFSLISQSIVPILARAFYSRHNTIIPVVINLFSMILNFVLAVTLGSRWGVMGIAVAFSSASVFSALVLFIIFRIRMKAYNSATDISRLFDFPLVKALTAIVGGSVLLGLASYGGLYAFAKFFQTDTVVGILLQLCFAGLAGVLAFLSATSVMKLEETRQVLEFLKKFWYTRKS